MTPSWKATAWRCARSKTGSNSCRRNCWSTAKATKKAKATARSSRNGAKNLAQNREQLRQSLAVSEERYAQRSQELEQLTAKFAAAEQQLQELRRELADEEAKLIGVTGGISQAQEEGLKGQLLEIMNQMAQARNDIHYAEQQKESVKRRMDRAEEEGVKWTEEQQRLKARKSELEAALEKLGKEISDLRGKYIQESERHQSLQKLVEESQGGIRKWEQKREGLVSRRDTMKEMEEDYDGFMLGVKEVLKAAKKSVLPGVHGAVAELIRVPEKLEIAVETALGGAMQHIVMENEAVSRQRSPF
ncbi:hypothetical protein HMSSN036_71330 [Paenibacillus macerans]|nr:hypothetical protein HMSSN036_71330 [Paenibacillus macerans]